MEFKKATILIFAFIFFSSITLVHSIKVVKSFKQLGEHHCSIFPIENLWRVATGTLSQKFGEAYFDFDCYIRQFVRADGLTIEGTLEDQEESEQDDEENEEKQKQLKVDELVIEYSKGLSICLPQNVDSIEATYAIWRFFRFLTQNDYIYEWMRAKIRATLGYQGERPNSWMDGQNAAPRLRLDKLFSNQFYEYIDQLMFKDFLFPLLTFFKQNTVIALSSKVTKSGKPILFQSLLTHNHLETVFEPVILDLQQLKEKIFSYTVPGVPLLFAGSSSSVSWAFTGVLVDRTNIEQIQTVGQKFYHHDTQQWLKLETRQVQIPGVEGKKCKYMQSGYGPLYTKQDRDGKNQEYIVRWHEKQSEVRSLFSGLLQLIKNHGNLEYQLQFPFNSIILTNETGIFQYICQQFYPSYFLYPDMFGQPEKLNQKWISYPTKKILVVSNSHLTTTKQDSYIKAQPQTPIEEQIQQNFKLVKDNKLDTKSLLKFGSDIVTTPHLKKLKDMLMRIYRKIKFFYLPEEEHRKKCDLLISLLEKWNGNLSDKKLAPIYILWEYFTKQYTFSHISASDYGRHIVKHRLLTDNYWVNQMILWEKGTSYSQCDSHQYERMKDEVNGTGHNSSCYLNIIRGINQTKNILLAKYQNDLSRINLDDFIEKKSSPKVEQYFRGNHIEEAFGVYYSRNILFSAEIGNPKIIYYHSYQQRQEQVNLSQVLAKKIVEPDEQL